MHDSKGIKLAIGLSVLALVIATLALVWAVKAKELASEAKQRVDAPIVVPEGDDPGKLMRGTGQPPAEPPTQQ